MASTWIRQRYQDNSQGVAAVDVVALPYLRVSTIRQERGYSPEAQRKEIAAYIRLQGWEPGPEFVDTDKGTKIERTHYQRLLTHARQLAAQGRSVTVVSVALDRFGRDLAEQLRSRKELVALGIGQHFTRDGGQLDEDGTIMRGWMAQKEVQKNGERVSASKRIVADQGLPPSGPAAWGYRWRLPQTPEEERLSVGRAVRRILDVDPAAAPAVRELFRQAAEGATLGTLARWVAGLSAEARGGRALGSSPVRNVLRNALYVGRYDRDPQGAGTPDAILAQPRGRWAPLVDDDTWRRVQARLDSHQKQPHQASGQYLLVGFARCPQCGNRMQGNVSGTQRRYRCIAYKLGAILGARCTMTATMEVIDADVLAQVGAALDAAVSLRDPRVLASARRAWVAFQEPSGASGQRQRELDVLIKRAQNRILRARESFFDGELPREEHDALVGRNRDALQGYEAERTELASTVVDATALPSFDDALADAATISNALNELDTPAKREALTALLERVVPERVAFGTYRTRITWTPLGAALAALANAL